MTTELDLLSPELALIDPELAERARRSLNVAAAAPRAQLVEAFPNTEPQPEPPLSTASPEPPRRHRRLTRAAAVLAVPSLILNVALLDVAPGTPFRGSEPLGAVAGTSTTIVDAPHLPAPAPQVRPAAAGSAEPKRSVDAGPVLRWKKLRAADMYDVVIWRAGHRVRDVWTRASSVPVRTLACATPSGRLAAGDYLWFVYPVRSATSAKRFGPLVSWGSFRVDSATCSRRSASAS
jgi:hypothetical protein